MKVIVLLLALLIAYTYADTCEAQGDPHVRTFSGSWWEMQKEGDYLLFQNKHVTVQIRNRAWGQNAFVVTGAAIKFTGSKTFAITSGELTQASIDGKAVSLKQSFGVIEDLNNKVEVLRTAKNQLKFVSANVVIILTSNTQGSNKWPQDHYYNIVIQTTTAKGNDEWKGACVEKGTFTQQGDGFKNKFEHKHFGPRPHLCTAEKLEAARKRCTELGFKNSKHFDICVFDTCHGFRARDTRKFFDDANRDAHLRDRDLASLVERAERAVKFQKLMKEQGVIIKKLKIKYESYLESFRKIVATEEQKRQQLRNLEKLESEYKRQITNFKSQEHSFKSQLEKYRLQRRTIQKKLVYLREQEVKVRETINKLTIRINNVKKRIAELTSEARRLYQHEKEDELKLKKIREQIRELKIKLTKYYSYEDKFVKKLAEFRAQRKHFESQIDEVKKKERQIGSLIRDLRQLNSEMFSIQIKKTKHIKKQSSCEEKVKKYKLIDERIELQLRKYREEIRKLRVELETYFRNERDVEKDERETRQKRVDIEKRIVHLRALLTKLRDERRRNRRNLEIIIRDEKYAAEEISKLRVSEQLISKQITVVIQEISKFENQVKITINQENTISNELKNLDLQRLQLLQLIRNLEAKIQSHNKLYEEYRRDYHNNLDKFGSVHCQTCKK